MCLANFFEIEAGTLCKHRIHHVAFVDGGAFRSALVAVDERGVVEA